MKNWVPWTILEALSRASANTLLKVGGIAGNIIAHAIFLTFIIGAVQCVAGFVVAKSRGTKLLTNKESVLGSCIFGAFGTAVVVLLSTGFIYGAHAGVVAFILTLAIIPGQMIDAKHFGRTFSYRQWGGVIIALFAGYSVLGWPSLFETKEFLNWVVFPLAAMVFIAANQGISKKIKAIDGFVKNFWGGLTQALLSLLALFAIGSWSILFDFGEIAQTIWIVGTIIGVINIGIWVFNIASFKRGADIAIKMMVMNGIFLTASVVLAALFFFDESFSVAKLVGILLFLPAFILIDTKAWGFLGARLVRLRNFTFS